MVVKDIYIPVVPLPGSENWIGAYEYGERLERRFPDQDGYDLAQAMSHNDWGPASTHEITGLVLEQRGENDESDWRWRVNFSDGSTWVAEGGCDYTGWDCQSHLSWTRA